MQQINYQISKHTLKNPSQGSKLRVGKHLLTLKKTLHKSLLSKPLTFF